MSKANTIFEKGLALFSALTSFIFVYYALGLLNAGSVPQWDKVFAYVAIGYGLGNIYILSAVWRLQESWTLWANKLIALCFYGVFLLDLFQTGVKSNLEYVGAVGLAGVLWLNWYAVKTLAGRRQEPAAEERKPKKPKGSHR